MKNLNRITLIGRLGADVEVTELKSKKSDKTYRKGSFSIANNDTKYDTEKKTWIINTTWINVEIWDKKLESFEKATINKGDLVYIEGRLHIDSYEVQDGTKRYKTYVVVDDFYKL